MVPQYGLHLLCLHLPHLPVVVRPAVAPAVAARNWIGIILPLPRSNLVQSTISKCGRGRPRPAYLVFMNRVANCTIG